MLNNIFVLINDKLVIAHFSYDIFSSFWYFCSYF